MVTISTTSEDKTSNCVVTPKKKPMSSANTTSSSTSATMTANSTSTSSNIENNSDQMAPNILVYKKVSGLPYAVSNEYVYILHTMCNYVHDFIFRSTLKCFIKDTHDYKGISIITTNHECN